MRAMKPINPNELHEIQGRILKELLLHPHRKFSELVPEGVPSDQMSFHVKRLNELGLIHKTEDRYELTVPGKEFANRFDTATVKVERQAKLGALVCCVRERDGVRKYLLQQRLKQPYYGFYGFVGGKIRWGETVEEAAKRELAEETGLGATLTLMAVRHKMDYEEGGNLLEDKFFFIFRGENAEGTLIERFAEGRNVWLSRDDLAKLSDVFPDVPKSLDLIDSRTFQFVEKKYAVEKY